MKNNHNINSLEYYKELLEKHKSSMIPEHIEQLSNIYNTLDNLDKIQSDYLRLSIEKKDLLGLNQLFSKLILDELSNCFGSISNFKSEWVKDAIIKGHSVSTSDYNHDVRLLILDFSKYYDCFLDSRTQPHTLLCQLLGNKYAIGGFKKTSSEIANSFIEKGSLNILSIQTNKDIINLTSRLIELVDNFDIYDYSLHTEYKSSILILSNLIKRSYKLFMESNSELKNNFTKDYSLNYLEFLNDLQNISKEKSTSAIIFINEMYKLDPNLLISPITLEDDELILSLKKESTYR